MNNILKNCTIGLIYVTAFIPLYVDNSLFFPFITGKAFAFRIIVEIMAALWLLLILRDRKYAPRFSWLSALVTAFMVIVLIADLAGVNPLRSIWSNFERMEGWLTIFHLWLYFIVTSSIFGTGEAGRRSWHRFFVVSIIAAVIVGIYGVVQLAGGAEIHQGSSRIDASLGNAAYMAVYMLGHAFLAFYLGLVEWSRNKRGPAWTFILLGAFFSFLVYETATRGTILGLVGGIMLALGIFSVFGKGYSGKLRILSGGVILLIVILGAGLVAAKNTAFVKSSPTLNRLATISWNENKTQARGYIWPVAVNGAFSTPKTTLIGWGQENFNYIFNANYNPKMWSQEQWFDRAHSVYLDWLVAAGLSGLLLYLSLYVFALLYIWKSSLTFAEKCIMTGLFVGYAIHNIFVFDNIASYMIFFTILGFAHSLSSSRSIKALEVGDDRTENQIVMRDYVYAPVIVIAFALMLYFVNMRPIQANHNLIKGLISCSSSPSVEPFEKAIKANQYVANQEIREQILSCANNVIASGLPQDTKLKFFNLSAQQIEEQIKATPNDARTFVLAGSFYGGIGESDKGVEYLKRALELSPNKQSIMVELGSVYLNTGKTAEALALLKSAYESAPENHTAQAAYATALIMSGDEKKAQEIAGDVNINSDERYLNAFIRLKKYDRVIAIYKNLIAKNPENMQYHGGLAAAYFESGQKAQALAQLEVMKTKFPIQKDQIEAAINQVKNSP